MVDQQKTQSKTKTAFDLGWSGDHYALLLLKADGSLILGTL